MKAKAKTKAKTKAKKKPGRPRKVKLQTPPVETQTQEAAAPVLDPDSIPDGTAIRPYCIVTGTRTDIEGVDRFIIRGLVPGAPWALDNLEDSQRVGSMEWQQTGHALSRPSDIYLCWQWHAVPMRTAVDEGYKLGSDSGKRATDPPQFGIGRDGTVVQFLDPSQNGCGRAAKVGLKGHETIVIENLNKAGLNKPTAAQVASAHALVKGLLWIYGMRNSSVLEDKQWVQ